MIFSDRLGLLTIKDLLMIWLFRKVDAFRLYVVLSIFINLRIILNQFSFFLGYFCFSTGVYHIGIQMDRALYLLLFFLAPGNGNDKI